MALDPVVASISGLLSGRRLTVALAAGAAATAAAAVLARRARGRAARRTLGAAAALGTAATLAGAWGHLVEPRWLTVTRVSVPWRGPALRIALLTDIHAGPADRAYVERIVRRTASVAADVVLLGGDFVEGVDADPRKLAALAPLAELRARLGVFAVLGNHDSEADVGDPTRRDAIVACLARAGIRILDNESVTLGGEDEIVLVGLGSWRAHESDPEAAFRDVDQRRPTLVLMHNFQSLGLAGVKRFDLAMAGHTHAGQACLPFTEVCPFLEADMVPYRYGLYDWPSGGTLFVSAGLGTSGAHVRVGARPEISVLELRQRVGQQ